jgi:hypothetical protein
VTGSATERCERDSLRLVPGDSKSNEIRQRTADGCGQQQALHYSGKSSPGRGHAKTLAEAILIIANRQKS